MEQALLVCEILFYCLTGTVRPFNVDTSIPLVKEGTTGSYFGFSLASHRITITGTNESYSVILVGAPRDNTTDGAPASVRRIVRPGAVYKCPVTTKSNDCTQLKIGFEEPRNDEDRSDQWMGSTVVSQGTDDGAAIVCAHRYKKYGASFRWGLGWCISLTNSLEEDRFWEPCSGKPKSSGHGEYGYCQAGTSAAISREGEIALGAPGPYNWRGAIFTNSLHDVFQTWHQSPVEDERPSDSREGGEGVKGGRQRPVTAYYSYLGMSVQIGNIVDGQKTYVAGAPRSGHSGQVLLFQMTANRQLTVDQMHYLTGEQFGSAFGYSVAVGDFNSDGLDDLAVGAPFYHTAAGGGGGIVYVYINSIQGIQSQSRPIRLHGRKMKEAECLEVRCHDAWFGVAIAAIGDINLDGFQDLAVGAPYEGNGAVYLFHGSRKGIDRDHAQRISPSDLRSIPIGRPLHSFGYSIAGRMDLDANGYPDVVIGAYSSDAVVVLWTRPVVDVTVKIDHWPPLIDHRLTKCILDERKPYKCFQLSFCFEFTRRSQLRSASDPLDLDVTVEAERSNDIFSRLFFDTSEANEFNIYNASIRMQKQNTPMCSNISVYLTPSNRDFLNPLKLFMTYKLSNHSEQRQVNERRQKSARNDDDYKRKLPVLTEILNTEQFSAHSGIEHLVDFVKNCGDDSRCQANLKVHGMLQLDRDEKGQYILGLGQDQEMKLFVRIVNRLEDAHETILTVLLPEQLKYRGTDLEGRLYSCVPEDGVVHCNIGNPLLGDQETSFVLRLDASNVDYSMDEFQITLLVNTTSIEVDDEDNQDVLYVKVILEMDLFIKGSSDPSEVFYGGEAVGESATRFVEDVGAAVKHSYEIKNLGKSKIPNLRLSISWPYEVESGYPHGKHLLYLTDPIQVDDERTKCFFDDKLINPLGLQTRSIVDPKPKNETEVVDNLRFRRSSDNNRKHKPELLISREMDNLGKVIGVAKLDCDLGTAKCHSIRCTIELIDPGDSVVISVLSRLWKSTFIEDYRSVDQVHVLSKAQLDIEFRENIRRINPFNDTDKAMTVSLPDIKIQDVRGVPLWVIISSVIAGVLFLCLVVWMLWKCGFFRRKRGVSMKHKAIVEKPDYHYNLLQHSTVTMTPRPVL